MQAEFGIEKMFIRDKAIMSRMARQKNKAFRRYGTITRRHARSLLKKANKKNPKSRRGEAPRIHKTSEPNLRTIFYAIDGGEMLTGPVGFGLAAGRAVPGLLESRDRPFMSTTHQEKHSELARSIEIFGLV